MEIDPARRRREAEPSAEAPPACGTGGGGHRQSTDGPAARQNPQSGVPTESAREAPRGPRLRASLAWPTSWPTTRFVTLSTA